MIIYRFRPGRFCPGRALEFHRTRREKPTMLLFRMRRTSDDVYSVLPQPGQLRLHCERWSQRREPRRPSSSRPAPRCVVFKRDELMRCVTAQRGQYDLQEIYVPGQVPHRHDRRNRHGQPLASAAAHHQLRHGGALVFPF